MEDRPKAPVAIGHSMPMYGRTEEGIGKYQAGEYKGQYNGMDKTGASPGREALGIYQDYLDRVDSAEELGTRGIQLEGKVAEAGSLISQLAELGLKVEPESIREKDRELEKDKKGFEEEKEAARDRIDASLWRASQAKEANKEQYIIDAVNEAAERGIDIDTEYDGKRVMPVEAAIKSATEDKRLTIHNGGNTYSPPPQWL